MVESRKILANHFIVKSSHENIQEDVTGFFELVGALLVRGALDEGLVYDELSFYILGWWSITKNYIIEERRRQGNDNTLFSKFEILYNRMITLEMRERNISKEQAAFSDEKIKDFLNDEARLER